VTVKPRLRGVLHQYAFAVSLLVGAALVVVAPSGPARAAVMIYALSMSGLFGTSALYHRIDWSPRTRRWMRRLDHAMIFVLIAGTYTPFALLVLDGALATAILVGVWGGAVGGIIQQLVWADAPKWLTSAIYVSLGAFAILAMPAMLEAVGVVPVALVGLGGLLYIAGAGVYAMERPDPVPAVFGFHEVFHALVIAAAVLQCAVVAFWVLPVA
jgi:hemolysin III